MMKHWWARLVLGSTAVNAPADSDDRPDAEFEARWRSQLKGRLLLVLAVIALWVAGIEARLVFLQVVSHEQWAAMAARQSEELQKVKPAADRGEITDRNGRFLAYSVEGYSLAANPSQVQDIAREVDEICAALADCSAAMRADFREKLGRRAGTVVLRDASALSPAAVAGIERLIASRHDAKRPAIVTLKTTAQGTILRANPSDVEDLEREVKEICAALGDCLEDSRTDLREKLSRKAVHIVLRDARSLSPAAAARLDRLIATRVDEARLEKDKKKKRPVVISVMRDSVRFYPQGQLASHVVGFTLKEGNGGGGIEAKFQKDLAGVPGEAVVEVDRDGREIQRRITREPTPGATAELTIDLGLQHICERELAAGVREFRAAGGVIVMMDPFTGGILAHCNFPTFNPNAYWEADPATRRDRAVTDTYEPGSTLKIVTAAAALNEGIWTTSELIDTNPGYIVIPGRGDPIREAKRHNYGVLSFDKALIKSSNVGAIRIGQRIGPELLAQYIRRMGLGQLLGADFSGQSQGSVPSSKQMSASTLASLSMGYEIGVTPLQMVVAASIVANGGQLVEPHLINAWIRNGRREEVQPRVLRRAIRPETAAALTSIMERVVEPGGTATLAALQNYRVAGKTGTAEKVVNGRYSKTESNVSFLAFLPSRQPRLTILVVIDTPKKGPVYGGTIAAPIFRRVAEAAMVHLGVTPSINPLPPVVVPSDRRATVTSAPRSSSIIPTLTRVGTRPVMPDVRGMSLRDALRVTRELGLFMTAEGSGVVVQQSPAPGEYVDADGAGALQLRRLPATMRNER